MKSLIRFKTKRAFERALMMHPICIMILGDMAWWAMRRGLAFIITESVSTEKEDRAISRKHPVHRQFRGFDIRIHGWSEQDLKDFEAYFENKYKEFAAIGFSTGNKNLVEIHVGTERHIHVQIALIYALNGINLEEKIYDLDS